MIDPRFEPHQWFITGIHVEENGLAAMLAANRLASVSPEVNLTVCVTCMHPPSTNKVLNPRGDVTRSP